MIRRAPVLAVLTLMPVLSLLPVSPANAQQSPAAKKKPPISVPKPVGPKAIGHFDDWIAATHQESGQPVCYAFTRVQNSTPVLPARGGVVLTVTERESGRDAVAIEAGFPFAPNAAVTVQAEQTALEFYTAQRAAFARNGHAAVTAFQGASRAVAHSPGPRGAKIVDTFSLKGFSAAYAAIVKACPPK